MSAPWIVVVVALWAFVIVLSLIVLGTLRRIVPILERAEVSSASTPSMIGLPLGEQVPTFTAERIDGGAFSEADLAGVRSLVLFLGSSCQACELFVRDLESGRAPALPVRLLIVLAEADVARALTRSSDVTVVVDAERSVARAFDSNLVPQAFLVGEHGVVEASGRPNDWRGLRRIVTQAEGGETTFDAAAAGVR